MDERPNRFIINNEEPLDDNGFSSSSNSNRIDDFDNSINEKLNNDQSDQLNIKNGQQFNAGRVGSLGIKPQDINKENNINNDINNKKLPQNMVHGAINKASTALPPGLKHAVRFGNNLIRRKNEKKEEQQQDELQRIQEARMQEKINQELNGEDNLDNLNEKDERINPKKNGLFGGLKKSIMPSFSDKKKVKGELDIAKRLNVTNKFVLRLLIILINIFPFILPAFVLIALIALVLGPISSAAGAVKDFATNLKESIVNFFTFNSFSTNETLVKGFEEKVDKTSELYPDMDQESLKTALYYGFYSFDEYLQELENGDSDDIEDFDVKHKFNFKKLKTYTFTVANQLIYSTVTFDNNIIQDVKEEEVEPDFKLVNGTYSDNNKSKPTDVGKVTKNPDGSSTIKKCTSKPNKDGYYECGSYNCKNSDCSGTTTEKTKKIKYEYSCPAGSFMIKTDKMNDLCVDDIGTIEVEYQGHIKNTRTADFCTNLVNQANIDRLKSVDKDFDEKMKCVTFTFETGTERSKEKYNNFLKYVMIPENYYDQTLDTSESYSWDKFISQFSEDSSGIFGDNDKDTYNIPAHAIGEGKIDLYSSLTQDKKIEVDGVITTLMSLIKSVKEDKNIEDRYHIPGAVSLPLDFQIKSTPEETIKSRVTSGFGARVAKIEGESTNHGGVDLSHLSANGTNYIYSALDGVVYKTYNSITEGCGIGAYLAHDLDGDGNYDFYTRYCHMSSRFVKEGDIVYNGQRIGIMGKTGTATGTHLHFEIRNANEEKMDPVPYLIDIVKNQSSLSTVLAELTETKIQDLESKYEGLISGKSHTREGVVITAKFLVDNLSGLPNFCDGYSASLIDSNWYKERVITGSCNNKGMTSRYGMSNIGYINWAFTQSGFGGATQYTFEELKKLGDKKNIYDESVQEGDIAYNGNDIGIIIELNEEKAVIAYVSERGLTTETISRKLASSPFRYVVSLNNFYGG